MTLYINYLTSCLLFSLICWDKISPQVSMPLVVESRRVLLKFPHRKRWKGEL